MKIVSARLSTSDNAEQALVKTSIFAGNGIFEEQKSWLGHSVKKANSYELGDEYPELEEYAEIDLEKYFPVIPKEALASVVKWYAKVTKENGQEAQVNFYKVGGKDGTLKVGDEVKELKDIKGIKFWSDEIFSYTPIQNNSGAKTSVSKTDKVYNELNKYYGIYIETHSHNSMSAFRSGTDKAYSENDGVQLVFGRLNTARPEMYSWVCIRGVQKAGLGPEELEAFLEFYEADYIEASNKVEFEIEKLEEIPVPNGLFEEWDGQVEVKKIAAPKKKATTYGKYRSPKKSSYGHGYGQYSFYGDDNEDYYYGSTYGNGYGASTSSYRYVTHAEKIEESSEMAIESVRNIFGEDSPSMAIAKAIIVSYSDGLRMATYTSKTIEELHNDILGTVETALGDLSGELDI